MPERVNSFAPKIPGVFSVLVVTITIQSYTPVRADSACIEQPNRPAAEGTRWSARYDRAKGRKCWFLVDAPANGHEAAAPQAQEAAAATPSLSSQITSLLDSLRGTSGNATPQAGPAQINPASGPRKPPANAANAGKTDNVARADQKGVGEAQPAKRVSSGLTQPQREALFEEFRRWHENQESVSTGNPLPASR
jgi:hypothetical protein